MAYLAKDDYTLRISLENLDEITEQGILASGLTADQFLSRAESWAMSYVKSYLASQYNIGGEYAIDSASTARNMQILQVTIDLALCTIHKTINPRDIPEHIAIACDEAKQWLMDARDAKVIVDIPGATPIDGSTVLQNSFIASQPKFISKPFQDLSLFDSPSIVP